MEKFLHRVFHIPCVILTIFIAFIAGKLIAMHDFWMENEDTINWYFSRIIRDVKCILPRLTYAIAVTSVVTPLALAFLILMIKLS